MNEDLLGDPNDHLRCQIVVVHPVTNTVKKKSCFCLYKGKGIHVVVEVYRSILLADVIGKVSARAHRLANLGAMSADLRGAFLAMSFTRAFAQSWLIRVTASVWQRVLQYFQTPRSFSSLFVFV